MPMKRTTIFLDPSLLRRARDAARREGKSMAQLVREAITSYLTGRRPQAARVPSVAARFATAHADTAERVDELLWRDPHA